MVQVKTFKIEDYESFNEFVKEHSPRGENGIKFNGTHIMVFYDEGEIMSKNDKIQSLRFELGRVLENQMQYVKQLREAIKTRDTFDPTTQSYLDTHSMCHSFKKMLELEVIKTSVVNEMLLELNVTVEFENYATPDIGPDPKPIVSPMQNLGKNKGK